ncbi:MAG: copper chaperone PCu(A)C [Gammaproteobacteria bacterium]|nr:copper chaperone PCu(A)C [Gammaproteobacteria bacterium]
MRKYLISFFLLLATSAVQAGSVTVDSAWIREAPPGMMMLAGYMVVSNSGDEARAIVSASGDDFGYIELHRSMIKDGMAKMIPQENIPVPAKGSVELKPGDYHLMLMQPKKDLKAGEESTLTIVMDNGESITITAPVKKPDSDMMMHHHHHH